MDDDAGAEPRSRSLLRATRQFYFQGAGADEGPVLPTEPPYDPAASRSPVSDSCDLQPVAERPSAVHTSALSETGALSERVSELVASKLMASNMPFRSGWRASIPRATSAIHTLAKLNQQKQEQAQLEAAGLDGGRQGGRGRSAKLRRHGNGGGGCGGGCGGGGCFVSGTSAFISAPPCSSFYASAIRGGVGGYGSGNDADSGAINDSGAGAGADASSESYDGYQRIRGGYDASLSAGLGTASEEEGENDLACSHDIWSNDLEREAKRHRLSELTATATTPELRGAAGLLSIDANHAAASSSC